VRPIVGTLQVLQLRRDRRQLRVVVFGGRTPSGVEQGADVVPTVSKLLCLVGYEVAIVKYVVHCFRSDGVAVDESVLDASVAISAIAPLRNPAQEQIAGRTPDLLRGDTDGAERGPHEAGCIDVVDPD